MKELFVGFLLFLSTSSFAHDQLLVESDFQNIKEAMIEYLDNTGLASEICIKGKEFADYQVDLPLTATLSNNYLVSSSNIFFRCIGSNEFIEGESCILVKPAYSEGTWTIDGCDL
jgi:hypothetical protein